MSSMEKGPFEFLIQRNEQIEFGNFKEIEKVFREGILVEKMNKKEMYQRKYQRI